MAANGEQLAALARITGLLTEAGIKHWLFGGWAVDFYLGEITRPHDDLDLAIWREELAGIARVLGEDDWRHAPDDDEDGGTAFERGDVRLDLTFLVRAPSGGVFTPLRSGPAFWAEDAFGTDVAELCGVRVPVIPFVTLKGMKSFARPEAADAAKDRIDLARLARLG